MCLRACIWPWMHVLRVWCVRDRPSAFDSDICGEMHCPCRSSRLVSSIVSDQQTKQHGRGRTCSINDQGAPHNPHSPLRIRRVEFSCAVFSKGVVDRDARMCMYMCTYKPPIPLRTKTITMGLDSISRIGICVAPGRWAGARVGFGTDCYSTSRRAPRRH